MHNNYVIGSNVYIAALFCVHDLYIVNDRRFSDIMDSPKIRTQYNRPLYKQQNVLMSSMCPLFGGSTSYFVCMSVCI